MKHIIKNLAVVILMTASIADASVFTNQEKAIITEWVRSEYAAAPVEIKNVAKNVRTVFLEQVTAFEKVLDVMILNPNAMAQHKESFREATQEAFVNIVLTAAEAGNVIDQYASTLATRSGSAKTDQLTKIALKLQPALLDFDNKFHACTTSEDAKQLKQSFVVLKEEIIFVLNALN